MGYSRTYNESIYVSGSVSASYPASEHGGYQTVHYSETVPVTINMYVDTDEFDESIEEQQTRVRGLTAAVAAMNSAQCIAIADSSKKIADHMIDGFFNTINSELTLQKTEKKSDIQAKFGLMKALADQIESTHKRMEDDLAKLKKHYSKIFRGLDEDLEKRVYELDRNAFYLSSSIKDGIVDGAYKEKVPSLVSEINMSSSANSMISTARLNSKTSGIIKKMLNGIEGNKVYMNSLSSVLSDETLSDAATEYIPAIIFNTNSLSDTEQTDSNYNVPDVTGKGRIMNYLQNTDTEKLGNEHLSEDEKEIIENNLILCIEDNQNSTESDERVYKEIMRMWKEDKERILK